MAIAMRTERCSEQFAIVAAIGIENSARATCKAAQSHEIAIPKTDILKSTFFIYVYQVLVQLKLKTARELKVFGVSGFRHGIRFFLLLAWNKQTSPGAKAAWGKTVKVKSGACASGPRRLCTPLLCANRG